MRGRKTKDINRRKQGFKVGHKLHKTNNDTLTNDTATVRESCQHNKALSGPLGTAPPVTRSQSKKAEKLGQSTNDEYFIANKGKLETMCNKTFAEHLKQAPTCKGFLHLKKTEQRSVSTSWRFVCNSCSFVGDSYKMYVEEQSNSRGRRGSTLNKAVGVALARSPIGVSVMSEVLLTIGVDPGAKTGMQDNLNKSSVVIENLASANMKEERQKLSAYSNVSVEADARYNNSLRSPNTPFQGGTQAVFTVAENMTPQKKIISTVYASKLCRIGSRLLADGIEVTCPDHKGCTATLRPQDAIGTEDRYANVSALEIQEDKVPLDEVTADDDSNMFKGFKKVFPAAVNLKDSRHFSQSQRKAIVKTQLSTTMITGTTQRIRKKKQGWFAEDVRKRCTAEFKSASKKVRKIKQPSEKKAKLKALLKKVPNCIIKCFSGNCTSCPRDSFVCTTEKPWSMYRILKENIVTTGSDKKTFRTLILRRLGTAAIDKTYRDTNTQKVEAINRAYNKTNPKNVTSIRNFRGRLCSVVLERNLGFADSTFQVQNAINHTVSANVRKKIGIKHKEKVYLLKYNKMSTAKKFRVLKRAGLYKLYRLNPKSSHDNEHSYRKQSTSACQ